MWYRFSWNSRQSRVALLELSSYPVFPKQKTSTRWKSNCWQDEAPPCPLADKARNSASAFRSKSNNAAIVSCCSAVRLLDSMLEHPGWRALSTVHHSVCIKANMSFLNVVSLSVLGRSVLLFTPFLCCTSLQQGFDLLLIDRTHLHIFYNEV